MTLLAPMFFYIAAGVAAGVIGLHFLSTQEPRSDMLPTVRFIPDVPMRATSVTIRASDFLLLALRVLAVLLLGLALARPQIDPPRQPVARIVAVDLSRAVARPAEVLDSARRHLDGAAAVVFFDSVAREVPEGAIDSLVRVAERPSLAGQGALSAALITSLRAASRLRQRADSLQLVMVTPLAAEERDAATDSLRALWPGRIDLVPVRVATASGEPPVAPRVEWADSGATSAWSRRERPDTIGGLRAGNTVVVAPFVRRWRVADSVAGSARVYARWADGEAAAVERQVGGRCVRSLAVAMPTAGDAMLRPDVGRFLSDLSSPCGEIPNLQPLAPVAVAQLAGSGPLAPASAIAPRNQPITPLVPWLLGLTLLLLVLELVARRFAGEGRDAKPAAAPADDTRQAA